MHSFQDFLAEDGESAAPSSQTSAVASNPSHARDKAKKEKDSNKDADKS